MRAVSPETRRIYVYCWRGGMRSGSVAWLLREAGKFDEARACFDKGVALGLLAS